MGYVPPRRVFLPGLDGEMIDATTFGDTLGKPADFGQPPKGLYNRPQGSYGRYIWELYGIPGRDWMPFLNGLAIVSFIALIAAIVAACFT